MKSYTEIKQELSRQCRNTRYFTKSFLRIYTAAIEKIRFNAENGIDDSFYDDGIGMYLNHSYDAVRKTDFYKKNSCAYCVFLEIVA